MKANCVVCGKEFRKLGAAKTCGRDCSKANKEASNRRCRAANPERTKEWKRRRHRKRYAADPEYRRKCIEASIKRSRKKYQTDPDFRDKRRKHSLERHRRLYATDPEWKAEFLMRQRRSYAAKKSGAFFDQLQNIKEQLKSHAQRLAAGQP